MPLAGLRYRKSSKKKTDKEGKNKSIKHGQGEKNIKKSQDFKRHPLCLV